MENSSKKQKVLEEKQKAFDEKQSKLDIIAKVISCGNDVKLRKIQEILDMPDRDPRLDEPEMQLLEAVDTECVEQFRCVMSGIVMDCKDVSEPENSLKFAYWYALVHKKYNILGYIKGFWGFQPFAPSWTLCPPPVKEP